MFFSSFFIKKALKMNNDSQTSVFPPNISLPEVNESTISDSLTITGSLASKEHIFAGKTVFCIKKSKKASRQTKRGYYTYFLIPNCAAIAR